MVQSADGARTASRSAIAAVLDVIGEHPQDGMREVARSVALHQVREELGRGTENRVREAAEVRDAMLGEVARVLELLAPDTSPRDTSRA